MGTTAHLLARGAEVDQIIGSLNSAYAYHLTAMHWTRAIINRLEGRALLHLGAELESAASDNLEAAMTVAGRVAELGGGIPADPSTFVELSPVRVVELPEDLGDPLVILGYALEQVRAIIGLYADLLEQTRNVDDLTHHLALGLLAAEVSREDQMEGALR